MAIDISESSIHLFQFRERLELLNDIDKFRQHGLANLPQIVVCGDTSSGKSSVLGALSGIAFPADSSLCTRFATEIALRYSSDPTVHGEAFISPAPHSSESHCTRIQAFKRSIENLATIPDVVREAREAMGLGDDSGISRDVLHLRLSGQPLPNLTLVDLPGLIHALENEMDIGKVQDLVEHYFRQEESLILIVVSGDNPINSQGILTSSKKFDPAEARSIGVLTKPDQAQRSDKVRLLPAIVDLARNQTEAYKFKRPWHIVRCLNDEERLKGMDRETVEQELLRQPPWNQFDSGQLGIKSLRSTLCAYLQEHIIRVLPQLIETLDDKIARVKASLDELGPPRAGHGECMQYLVKISTRYGQLVHDALDGDYTDAFFSDAGARQYLRATTMAMTDDFEISMRTRGHTFEIAGSSATGSHGSGKPLQTSRTDALARVGKLLESHRGPELGFLFNPRLVGELFKEQSRNWPARVSEYTSRVCQAVQAFLRKAIEYICPKAGETSELILRHIFDDALYEIQETLQTKVSELYAPYFGAFLYSAKTRLQQNLAMTEYHDNMEDKLEREHTTPVARHRRNTSSTGSEISTDAGHDTRVKVLQYSRAYYSVALETFIDNIVLLGVESCLLSKLGGIFSPETVVRMDEALLRTLGGEASKVIREREDLQTQLMTLQASLKTCKRHISREFTSSVMGMDIDHNPRSHVAEGEAQPQAQAQAQAPQFRPATLFDDIKALHISADDGPGPGQQNERNNDKSTSQQAPLAAQAAAPSTAADSSASSPPRQREEVWNVPHSPARTSVSTDEEDEM